MLRRTVVLELGFVLVNASILLNMALCGGHWGTHASQDPLASLNVHGIVGIGQLPFPPTYGLRSFFDLGGGQKGF